MRSTLRPSGAPRAKTSRPRRSRAISRAAASRIAPSRWIAAEAERRGLGRATHLPHGVAAGPEHTGGGPFLFLGTLSRHKGPDLVWQAHKAAKVSAPLLIHGPPGPDAAYVATVQNAGPIGDPGPLLAQARALVLGSRWPENAPLVVLEARAAGCPVIAPAIGGLPELVEPGVDGWLYEPGNTDALAMCIREAMVAPPLPVRPPLSLDAHVDRLIGVYDSVR